MKRYGQHVRWSTTSGPTCGSCIVVGILTQQEGREMGCHHCEQLALGSIVNHVRPQQQDMHTVQKRCGAL